MTKLIVDGTSRMEACKCTQECEWPCWQRVGLAPACEQCGCGVDTLIATVKRPPPAIELHVSAPEGTTVSVPRGVRVHTRHPRPKRKRGE